MVNKHVPLRTCVNCGSKTAKRELVRIVATPLASVRLDVTGKSPGRGAYLCGDCSHKHTGLKKGRLEHVLRTSISDDDWEKLIRTISLQIA